MGVPVFKPQHRRKTMTPEQRRRRDEEERRRRQSAQRGSTPGYMPVDDSPYYGGNDSPSGCDTGSDSGGSCGCD
ncbi:hypothetical protein PARSHIK_281 [Erwinia phage vB_EamM_Parshik]|nr:hypothetical protein PARSHIK_281 [Erwinia phage vB_EamM_Parshik]